MSQVSGLFFDGQHSKKEQAVLRSMNGTHWRVLRPDGSPLTEAAAVERVEVSSRLGSTPRFVRFADGGVFETRDNDGVDVLLAPHRGQWHGLPHRLESSMRYALLGVLVTVAFVFAVLRYGVPAGAEYVAFKLAPETSRSIGRGTLTLLDRSILGPSKLSEIEQERWRQRMLGFIDNADGVVPQIEFRYSPRIGANAFALPSGVLVFTDQLVALAQSDEDLLAIYAHEVGHVVRRHAMRQLLQASTLTVLAALVTGDVSSTSSLITAAPLILTQTSYSRDFEREADYFAWQRMQQHNIPPAHFTAMLQRIEDSHRGAGRKEGDTLEDYLSTHPATQERVRMFGKAER
ncbi:peptidase M48 [Betaproteobacteria bacterium]|nr:peptidase M48 [Betaproteobacteria bacterium]GHU23253.1 peptidase M48 [Betaproteobacteria bacterium]